MEKYIRKKIMLLWVLSLGVLVQSIIVLNLGIKIKNKEEEQFSYKEELSSEVQKIIEEGQDER